MKILRLKKILQALSFALISVSAFAAAQTPALEKAIIAVPSLALSMLPVFFAQDRDGDRNDGWPVAGHRARRG
jgi:hypothetical protein